MSLSADELYRLLPAVHRLRDAELGEPLRALMAVIAEQAQVIEDDIARLYENAFIETCDEWVVPYFGDLLGARGLNIVPGGVFSQRGRVANTLAYRRRKGTATMLEQLARDTTGWPARAVEFFERLSTTQNVNHVRKRNFRTPDLRDTAALEHIDTAFDNAAHSLDVRRIRSDRGRHNIPNVGLFLWRLQSYFVHGVTARAVSQPGDGRFTFSPLGDDIPLFNRPQTERDITHLADEQNIPGPLRLRPLSDELTARRRALANAKKPAAPVYFGSGAKDEPPPVLRVSFRRTQGVDPPVEIQPEQIFICDLREPEAPFNLPGVWRRPPAPVQPPDPTAVALDPVRGRLAFPSGIVPFEVRVSYAYGFSGDIGAGPYTRRGATFPLRSVTWQAGVRSDAASIPPLFSTLEDAIDEWNLQDEGAVGVIALMDSATYKAPGEINIKNGSQLLIVAADWPEVPVKDAQGQRERVTGQFVPSGLRPHVLGNVSVKGTAQAASDFPGSLALDGLLIEGKLSVLSGNLGELALAHSTLVPSMGGLTVRSKNARLRLSIARAICGPVAVTTAIASLQLDDSLVDGVRAPAIDSPTSSLDVQRCTVLGTTSALLLEAGNSVFTDAVTIVRRQAGCVRFSYVPDEGSQTPRRFRCQPELAMKDAPKIARTAIRGRLVPVFTAERFGDPGYGQLRADVAPEISTGAEDGSEMGVFCFLKQPQRKANLLASLDEYLRLGLEAGLIDVT